MLTYFNDVGNKRGGSHPLTIHQQSISGWCLLTKASQISRPLRHSSGPLQHYLFGENLDYWGLRVYNIVFTYPYKGDPYDIS